MGGKGFFSCLLIAGIISFCNMPTRNEGIIQDSISMSDSFAAKVDWAHISTNASFIKIDSTLIFQDSVTVDNTINKDTGLLAPSLGIDVKGKHPAEVMAFAETLVGVPYVYGSINPKVGFDCSGFITYVFNRFGIQVPRSSIDFTNVGKTIPVETAKRGDIILFTGTNPMEQHVGHMGLIVSNNDTLRFIHSTSGKAMGVTTTPLSKYYLGRFVKVIRIFPQNDR
jgi:cell wall-associated NlpC family hydrolase